MNLSSMIFILNTKIISQVVYRATSIYIEPAIIKQIKTKIVDFFWDNKPSKIKYSTIISDHNEGGIRLVDIES